MTSLHLSTTMVAIAVVTVLGDYYLKLASQLSSPYLNRWFFTGLLIYSASAFGWVYAMRHMKLATVGIVYSLSTVLLLAALGVVIFREPLNRYEIVGICLGALSIVLMVRFA